MPDPLIDPATVAISGGGLIAMLATVGKWLLGREVRRIDAVADAVTALQRDHVSHDHLDKLADRFEATVNRLGDKIEGKVDAVHRRIDQIQGLPPRE